MLVRKSTPLMLASLTAVAPLSGQVLEALRMVPRNAQGLLIVPDPVVAKSKLEALLLRTKNAEKSGDLLQSILKDFGLETVPQLSKGLVVAFLPGDGPNGEPVECLVTAPGDFKAWMQALKAKTKNNISYTFTVGEKPFLAAQKGNWALITKAAHAAQLKRAIASQDSVLAELEELPNWLMEGDAGLVMTPKGLQTVTFFARKGLAEQRAKGRSIGSNAQVEEKMEAFLHQAEREVLLVAARASLNEKGDLIGNIRLRLSPSGSWAALGRGLSTPRESGLSSLPAIPYFVAAGGSLPKPWINAISELGTLPLKPLLSGIGMKPDHIKRFLAYQEQSQEGITGIGLAIPIPGEGMMMPIVRLDVEDSAAVLDRQEVFVRNIQTLFKDADLPSPYETRREDIEGFPTVVTTTQVQRLSPKSEGPEVRQAVDVGYMAPDAQTVLMGMGGSASLIDPAKAFRNSTERLSSNPDLAYTVDLLPQKAQLFAFFNLSGLSQMESKNHHSPLPPEAQQDFGFPTMPSAPPVGVSFTFDLDRWELNFALPSQLQEAMGTFESKKKEALEREKQALEAWQKTHPEAGEEDE